MNTLENSCFQFQENDEASKECIRIMNERYKQQNITKEFIGYDNHFYFLESDFRYASSAMPLNKIEVSPQDYLALLTQPKQLTVEERKYELEKILVVGAKIKIGKEYAEENSCVEGEIFELVEGHFEYDNGLYTEDQTAPSIWEEISKEFNSIYHLFGNNLENFMDCELLPTQESVKGEDEKCETIIRNLFGKNASQLIGEYAKSQVANAMHQYSTQQTAHIQQQLKEAKELLKELESYLDDEVAIVQAAVSSDNYACINDAQLPSLYLKINQFLTRNK